MTTFAALISHARKAAVILRFGLHKSTSFEPSDPPDPARYPALV